MGLGCGGFEGLWLRLFVQDFLGVQGGVRMYRVWV